MTSWFVTRHSGAKEWSARHGVVIDRQVSQLPVDELAEGDIVAGTLPVHLAAEVCSRGGRFFHLAMHVPAALRGCELSADDMEQCNAVLEEFRVEHVAGTTPATPGK